MSRRNVYTKNISVNKVLRYEKKEKINNISYFKKFNAKLDVKKKLANSNIKKLIKTKSILLVMGLLPKQPLY